MIVHNPVDLIVIWLFSNNCGVDQLTDAEDGIIGNADIEYELYSDQK